VVLPGEPDAPRELVVGNVVSAATGGMYVERIVIKQQTPQPSARPMDWVVSWRGAAPGPIPYASGMLAGYMSKVLGVHVPTVEWPKQPARDAIVLTGVADAPPKIARGLEDARLDAFAIKYPVRLDGRDVCLLVAKDPDRADYPVYYFLRELMGVEWVGPAPAGEAIPSRPTWTLPAAIDVLEDPDYEHRYWASPAFNARRWLGGSFRLQFHHNLWRVFHPETYGDQPGLYPYYGGQRHVPDVKRGAGSGWQPCTSNPEAVRIATAYGLRYLKEHPDHRSFSLSVNDGGAGICLCEGCLAQDSKTAFDYGAPNLSDRFFRFYNAVIENVCERNPAAYLAVLGYGRMQLLPEQVRINPRILVFNVCDNDLTHMARRQGQWRAAGAVPCIYLWMWDCGYLTVRHYPRAVRDLVRETHRLGGFGHYCEAITNWAAGGPKFYVFAHVLWDTDADVDALLDRYLAAGFGAGAAPAMRAYFDWWEQIWERLGEPYRYNTGRHWRSATQLDGITRDDLAHFDTCLRKAAAAPANADETTRIGYVRTYYEWLRVNADQRLVARELADREWVRARTPKEVMSAAERGLGLTQDFDRIWKETISQDRTGWLMSVRYRTRPDELWQRLIRPIRRGVIDAYEPAIDQAFGTLTEDMLRNRTKPDVLTFWRDSERQHPTLARWARTQACLLEHGPGENLVRNGGFEQGTPGEKPTVEGWSLSGAWQDVPALFKWADESGREGGRALALGRGYRADARTTVPLVKGARYRLTLWYSCNSQAGRLRAGLPDATITLQPTGGDWRRASTSCTARRGSSSLTLSAFAHNKGEWTRYDDVEVVRIDVGEPDAR